VRNKIREEDNTNLVLSIDIELEELLERSTSTLSRMRELELFQYGLTQEQAAILHILQIEGGLSTYNEIANIIVRQYHSVASIVNRMEKIGLVKKIRNKDNKKFIVSITKKGINKYTQIVQIRRNLPRIFFEGLSLEQKQQLYPILQELLSRGRKILGLDSKLPFLSKYPEAK